MNIAYFLTPKRDVVWVPQRATMRQALERMDVHRYAAVPVLDDDERYLDTLTEGDLLCMLKRHPTMTFEDSEQVRLTDVPRGRKVQPVHVNAHMEQLFTLAASQNFVPVVDDRDAFIGIVRRSSIIDYAASMGREGGESVPSLRAVDDREQWVCTLDRGGVVVGVAGGAPENWLGVALWQCPGAGVELKHLGHLLVSDWGERALHREGHAAPPPAIRRTRRPPYVTLVALAAIRAR